jgi:hypothetical protein
VKKALTALDTETVALAVSILWLLLVQVVAVLAWQSELLTRQGALLHWLAVGVLPPALALWNLQPDNTPQR